jgi:hypothetical protein
MTDWIFKKDAALLQFPKVRVFQKREIYDTETLRGYIERVTKGVLTCDDAQPWGSTRELAEGSKGCGNYSETSL